MHNSSAKAQQQPNPKHFEKVEKEIKTRKTVHKKRTTPEQNQKATLRHRIGHEQQKSVHEIDENQNYLLTAYQTANSTNYEHLSYPNDRDRIKLPISKADVLITLNGRFATLVSRNPDGKVIKLHPSGGVQTGRDRLQILLAN